MDHRFPNHVETEHVDAEDIDAEGVDDLHLVALNNRVPADTVIVAWIDNHRFFEENGPADDAKLDRADGTFERLDTDEDRTVLAFDEPIPEAPMTDGSDDGGYWIVVVGVDRDLDYGQDFSDYGGSLEGEIREPETREDDSHGVRT